MQFDYLALYYSYVSLHYVCIVLVVYKFHFHFYKGIVVLLNGNKNMEGTIEAAYEAIIPAFKNFEVANAAKVSVHMYLQHSYRYLLLHSYM